MSGDEQSSPPHQLKPKVHWSRASGYFELGMLREAEIELSALPEDLPWGKRRRAMLMNIRQNREQWEDMRDLAHGLRMEFPEDAEWWVADAYATRRGQSIQLARKILLEGLVHHYNDATIRYNLACYACQLGSPGECLDFLKEAVKRDPSFKKLALEDEDLEDVREALLKMGWGDRKD